MKLRLQPIRVYCLHHVTKEFDAKMMHDGDWMQIDVFIQRVTAMQQDGIELISLTDAYQHLSTNWFRRKKYAVLTFDDGWMSLNEILPWLSEQQIPVTLFLNPAYLHGQDTREIGRCLKERELNELIKSSNGTIQIASHGWNHALCTEMSIQEFKEGVDKSDSYLKQYASYVPFFAYPCGRHTVEQDRYLQSKGIVPVYIDGKGNYNEITVIHRENLE